MSTPIPTPTTAPMPTPTPAQIPTPTPNPPLNVYLDSIGVLCDHSQDDQDFNDFAEVGLVVSVSDGKAATEPEVLPHEGGYYYMSDFDTEVLDQRVFHTDSVGDYLEIVIIAYDIDVSDEWSHFLQTAAAAGIPETAILDTILHLFPQKDDEIGYYSGKWYEDEKWGTGYYEYVGHKGLRVWFSIQLEGELMPTPSHASWPSSSQPIEYTMPPGWLSGSFVTYGNYLRFGDEVVGTVELTGEPPAYMEWDYTWCCEVLDPHDNSISECCQEWNEDTSCNLNFTASQDGYYKIKVRHASYWEKYLTIEITPAGWSRPCE